VVDAVDSVIAQTYQKYDVLVVNDSGGSLPNLPAFVRTYDTGVGATGPANTRNVGIAEVKTPYFILLDADDILHPDALELMMPLAAPDMLVYSDWVVHETGEVHECSEWSAENLMQTMFMSVSCVYPTKLVREIGGFDTELAAWEDYDLIINLCAHGVCGVRVPVPLLQYRVQSGTVREKIYANKESALAAMRAKWKESDFMACGACAQRANDQQLAMAERQQNPFASNSRVVNAGDTSDLVQVQFILPEQSARVYMGQTTGQQYRFSADEPIQYVYKADLPDLMALTKVFRLFVGSTEAPHPVEEVVAAV
jgi:glycosyltransferase involved in cell wall biosynthesis